MRRNYLLAICFVFGLVWVAVAQPPDSGGGLFESVDDVPIDSAIAALMALGAGFGISKLYKRK